MWFPYAEDLKSNPCVYKVNARQVILKTEFRIKLYKLWRDGRLKDVESELSSNGLGMQQVGSNYLNSIFTSFKNSGFPLHHKSEIALNPNVINENPIIASGVFELLERRKGICLSQEYDEKLFSQYPEVSVSEGLRLAGVDPVDVGYLRLMRIEKEFNSRAKDMYPDVVPQDISSRGVPVMASGTTSNKEMQMKLSRHPYVKEVSGRHVVLKDSFYNESYILADVGLEKLFEVYELPADFFNSHARMVISAKLFHWKATDSTVNVTDDRVLRIWQSRLSLMEDTIAENFKRIRDILPDMGIEKRRKLAEGIDSLPRDPWGHYTTRRVLDIIGMPKSTYYELLHNENYGNGAARRAMRDDEDILLVRKVAEYKGYKKGYRQICMMMEDVTGKTMSPHRVLYLMRKYGMRTNIRKPSKNRKAMKELMKRNGKSNLLMRRFRLHRPNKVRLTDVTYLDYGKDLRAYGSASVDPVTGKLICFVVSENNDLQLALDTLEAMDDHPLKSGGIIHSDQGILYFTDDFQAAVKERDLIQSMSRRGNCWDNAPQESFFGHFKDECDYRKCRTLKELQSQIDDYRVYYNEQRRLWGRGRMTPAEYEHYLEELDDKAFKEYMKKEEAAYRKKKERTTQGAIRKAKAHKKEIKELLEEIKNETGGKAEV